MKRFLTTLLAIALIVGGAGAKKNVWNFKVKNAEGQTVSLKQYKGSVLLIVNTATHCGFTPQYDDLQELYSRYHAKGFEVLDFPCNQFGGQAPESIMEIKSLCTSKYNTSFPLFDKIDVNGPNASPLFEYLKNQQPFRGFGNDQRASFMHQMLLKQDADHEQKPDVKWNFTKFLVDRRGRVIARFEPTASISEVERAVEEALKK